MGRGSLELEAVEGATLVADDEKSELIPSINTKRELDELEKANIRSALRWARRSRKLKGQLLTVSGLLELHKKMFSEVWTWAGRQRTTEKNIGIAPHLILIELQKLCQDITYWIENRSYPWSEIAVRFHHRLVQIHPFVNGNGRHARITANLLLRFNNQPELSWGQSDLSNAETARREYLSALKKADQGSFEDLLRFAV